tara:strand:- start:285 stop:767 length:483 start_codon:yes stop_codon:yes gene_type:complete
MMTVFDMTPLFSTTIGFDRLARALDSARSRQDISSGYPPYDIMMDGDDKYRITMAIAGFARGDITIEMRESLLQITGQKDKKESGGEFLYQGIAERNFKTEFQLADHVEVEGAHLSEGLLTIDLVRKVPEALKPKQIEIKTSAPSGLIGKAKEMLTEKAA